MKTQLLIALILGLCLNLSAQKVIENPYVEANNTGVYFIDRIILQDSATIMECTMNGVKGQWFSIPSGTYIQVKGSKEKYHVKSMAAPYTVNKSITPKEDGPIKLQLTFPPLPKDADIIDYIEGNKGGNWRLYGIALTDEPVLDYLPNSYCGHWLKADGSNEWTLSFLKEAVVYKGVKYEDFSCEKKGNGYLLVLGDEVLTLSEKDRILTIVSKGDKTVCATAPKYNKKYKQAEVELPTVEFKSDMAVLSGCLSDYSPKIGKTGTLYINDVMSGEQIPKLIKIEEDGTFSVEAELLYPQTVYIRLPNVNISPVLIPGKEIKVLLKRNRPFYIGEAAQLNEMLAYLVRIRNYDFRKIQKEITEMTPSDYKKYCDEVYAKNLKRIKTVSDRQGLCVQLEEFAKLSLQLRYAEQLLSYNSRQRSAKYKLSKEGKDYEYEEADNDYYLALRDLPWENTQLMMTPEYKSFINRFMFSPYLFLRKGSSIVDVINYLQETGHSLPENEQKVFDAYKAFHNLDWVKARAEITSNDTLKNFMIEHRDEIRAFAKNYKGEQYYTDLPIHLKEKELEVSEGVLELMKKLSVYESDEFRTQTKEAYDHEAFAEISGKYRDIQHVVIVNERIEHRNGVLMNDFGKRLQLHADVMASQELCPSQKSPLPLNEYQLKAVEEIKTPWVKAYVLSENEKAKVKAEECKHATGFNVNKVPESEADKLFDEMLKPFRGKVVYVDFWATWCRPCLGGMQRVKPLKEELKDNKDIVFMYITNHSSPEEKWKAIIADTKGEHYRLSQDEWNVLSSQFSISGIPHYMLVNKKGHVVINDRSIDPGHNLKETLLKYAQE